MSNEQDTTPTPDDRPRPAYGEYAPQTAGQQPAPDQGQQAGQTAGPSGPVPGQGGQPGAPYGQPGYGQPGPQSTPTTVLAVPGRGSRPETVRPQMAD